MSLTDEIYHELMDALEKGLDWQQILAKHGASKGPLYNALGGVLAEIRAKLTALNEEKKQVQEKLDDAGLRLDSLNQQIKEAESNVARLEDRENGLNEQIETLETELTANYYYHRWLGRLNLAGFGGGYSPVAAEPGGRGGSKAVRTTKILLLS